MNTINPIVILIIIFAAIALVAVGVIVVKKRKGVFKVSDEVGSNVEENIPKKRINIELKSKLDLLKNFLISPVGYFFMIGSLYLPIWGVMLAFLTVFDAPIVAVIMGVALAYFGWQALSRITPNIFLIMPIGGWITYYIIKACLSVFLGVFVAPVIIGKRITNAITNQLSKSNSKLPSEPVSETSVNSSLTTLDDGVSEFDKMMSSIVVMSEDELEKIHRTLLFYMRDEPVPTEGRDYLSDLLKYRRTPVRGGSVYGCRTYGEIEKLNEAIVNRLS